jgi:hypothetical protein
MMNAEEGTLMKRYLKSLQKLNEEEKEECTG